MYPEQELRAAAEAARSRCHMFSGDQNRRDPASDGRLPSLFLFRGEKYCGIFSLSKIETQDEEKAGKKKLTGESRRQVEASDFFSNGE